MADTPSRLSDGKIYYNGGYISIQEYRNIISARNLYNLNNEYENTQLFSEKGQFAVADSIQTVLNVIPQYNRMQVNTNLAGNVYDAFRDEGSPLAKIGLIMLGKQLAYNSATSLSAKYVPTIDLSQVLKGNPDKIFTWNGNNRITIKKGYLNKIGNFVGNATGTYNIIGDNPFPNNPNRFDYIENTGKGQLKHFFSAINLNIYKPLKSNDDNYTQLLMEYSEDVGINIDLSRKSILSQQPTFTFNDKSIYPYFGGKIGVNSVAIDSANISIDKSYSANTGTVQEYGYNIEDFGSVIKEVFTKSEINNYVGEVSNFSEDNDKNKLIWGRDGVGSEAKSYIKNLRGDSYGLNGELFNNATYDSESFTNNKYSKNGLLEYTRNLLNATEGKFIDITRKAFKEGDNYIGFNGSPLWKANESEYAKQSNINSKTGIRQHTILDPYNRFAKSIRFKGNIVYNAGDGNENSVVYKTVLPRIHPTMNDKGEIDNKNLMFSIENLAVTTIKREKYGVIDDEYGTPIPLSEVGPFAGRMMWFPPYNIQLNEVAMAKYEPTVMIGRNEPMYNYINSERTAVLTFSLLVDYPEQLQNIKYRGKNKNKIIADFFAFGGDPFPVDYQIEVLEQKIEKLKSEITKIEGPTELSDPPNHKISETKVYFPNDVPTESQVNTVFDFMYKNNMHYEIIEGLESANDGNGYGLNQFIYYRTGLTSGATKNVWTLTDDNFSQYDSIAEYDQFGICEINSNLLTVFGDEKYRKNYDIIIAGRASKLYLGENEKTYNEALGNRRAESVKVLIISKLTKMFGETIANEIAQNIKITESIGSTGASNDGADAKNMHEKTIKQERFATINIILNNNPIENKEQILTEKKKEDIAKIQRDIQNLELQLALARKNVKGNIFEERSEAILNGFESISSNEYYPVFHSQTPEDFHRRLTFLQQCTRQGAAKRYDNIDENGNLTARNSVFGKQPICILRVGDFWYTKVIIDNVTIDYTDCPWDMNPEGFGMQPMMANITLQMKVIGGQSLKGPIDALQNAVSFNYYANSNYTNRGFYFRPSQEADSQATYIKGIVDNKTNKLNDIYQDFIDKKTTEGEK